MDLCFTSENGSRGKQSIQKRMGAIPIMVKSRMCYLRDMDRQQLVAAKEESTEFGGYFICNGIERIIRMLILQVGGGRVQGLGHTSSGGQRQQQQLEMSVAIIGLFMVWIHTLCIGWVADVGGLGWQQLVIYWGSSVFVQL